MLLQHSQSLRWTARNMQTSRSGAKSTVTSRENYLPRLLMPRLAVPLPQYWHEQAIALSRAYPRRLPVCSRDILPPSNSVNTALYEAHHHSPGTQCWLALQQGRCLLQPAAPCPVPRAAYAHTAGCQHPQRAARRARQELQAALPHSAFKQREQVFAGERQRRRWSPPEWRTWRQRMAIAYALGSLSGGGPWRGKP